MLGRREARELVRPAFEREDDEEVPHGLLERRELLVVAGQQARGVDREDVYEEQDHAHHL